MIKGIGTDIIEIDRITKSLEKQSFLDRIYTVLEQKLYHGNNPQTLAGNFAAKEAVAKALGSGFKGCSPLEIEILRKRSGQPFVNLYGNAQKIFYEIGGKNILISISHNKESAIAYAIIEG
jgi:holo-[acyl-carrier-protein] synthase